MRSGVDILEEALGYFPAQSFHGCEEAVSHARARLQPLDLERLYDYHDYVKRSGAPEGALGPDVQALWMKSPMHASVEYQHKPSTSELAAPNLLDWGIGPQQHEELSAQLRHPFAQDPPVEADLQFVIDAYVANGPRIQSLRRARLRVVERVARALRPLDAWVLARRHVQLRGAPGVRPVYIAFMVALMGWPDKGLPSRLAQGFELAGVIPPSGILRPIAPRHIGKGPEPEPEEQVFGDGAVRSVEEVEAIRHPSRHVGTIWDLTQAEIDDGIADPGRTRDEMDALHGCGNWRPLVRHVIWQSDKWRPIDDGKRSRTNTLSSALETVVCIPPEFTLVLLKSLLLALMKAAGGVPAWFKPKVSLEDWWKGFRQLFPSREHMGLAVVAVMDPTSRAWAYVQLRGLPFGLGSAVNQFTRMAVLLTALNRRILLILTGHYADDSPTVELGALAGLHWSAANVVKTSATYGGVKYSSSKYKPPACVFNFLGHLHDLARTAYSLSATWGPKLHTRERLVEMAMAAIRSRHLSSGTASKMRGLASWMDAALAGRCLRAAGHALTARQYWDRGGDVFEGSNLWESLRYIAAAAQWMPDRCVSLVRPEVPPVRIYTDAAADEGRVRLGAKMLLPDGRTLITVLDADEALEVSACQGAMARFARP